MPSPTNRTAGQTVASADINALATLLNSVETVANAAETPAGATAKVAAASTTDRARANHTGAQAISTITSLQATLDSKETPAGAQAKADAASTNDRARVNHTGSQAISTITDLQAGLDAKARGDIIYLWGGATFALATGQVDDGVSPRSYRGGAEGVVEAQSGHVPREGDIHFAVTT